VREYPANHASDHYPVASAVSSLSGNHHRHTNRR